MTQTDLNVTQKLIRSHLLEGSPTPGVEIGLKIDQTLTQDATGTLVMLELEALGLDRVKTEISAQYVDHNLIQEDNRNPDDHRFLHSACRRWGFWYSRPGNGVSHPVHQERFGKPGKTLVGSDSHTPAAGAIGMLAIGAGGLEVALAAAGRPFYLQMPEIWGVHLKGSLLDWVSAKDVILEMLRRHGVSGGVNRVIEYYGEGLQCLSAMDRHVIANMGTELGATSTVFPSDQEVRHFLKSQGREEDWQELLADPGASYDLQEEIDLSQLEPLVAKPSSPGNVVPVREIEGQELYQAYVGSSANPGYRDFAVVARILEGRRVDPGVSLDINPSSRQILENLIADGHLLALTRSGARIHQAGCNGCIGMGQAPATGSNSLRTVPRNFPGRSGTREDRVFLVSPETAAASALMGKITDPRNLPMDYPHVSDPENPILDSEMLLPPLEPDEALKVALRKGPNIKSLPPFQPLRDELRLPVLLKVQDDISTDEILPAGNEVLPFRSNIPRISEFAFRDVDPEYARRTRDLKDGGIHAIVGGENYGQGSSREHAALAPYHLGLRLVIAKTFARIHRANLINFGILPVTFADPADLDRIDQEDVLRLGQLEGLSSQERKLTVRNLTKQRDFPVEHDLSERQIEMLHAGGLIEWVRGDEG